MLFDMDGTLVDSEPRWQAVEAAIMADWEGPEWTERDGAACTGKPMRVSARAMLAHAGREGDEDAVVSELVGRMAQSYSTEGVPWMPGSLSLIDDLVGAGIRVGLVSSSYRVLVDAVLASAGPGRFGVSIAGDEVDRAKPHPEPYLRAADLLGVPIGACVVVEDSASGLAAGHAAGAHLVALGDASADVQEVDLRVRAVGDLTVAGLAALTRACASAG